MIVFAIIIWELEVVQTRACQLKGAEKLRNTKMRRVVCSAVHTCRLNWRGRNKYAVGVEDEQGVLVGFLMPVVAASCIGFL